MDKQLLEQEADKYLLSLDRVALSSWGVPTLVRDNFIKKVYIAGATSSSTVKNLMSLVESLWSDLSAATGNFGGSDITFEAFKKENKL